MSATPVVPTLGHFIGGAVHASSGDRWIADVNPADRDDVVAYVPEGTADDVRVAVAAAAEALPGWRASSGPTRAEHLHRWAAVIAERAEVLAQLVTREVGKPIGEARGEVARCVVILRYHAGEAVRSHGDVIPAQTAGTLQFTLREPLGVVALITPWNFPLAIPLWKAAPALAFGNTVVLKPAEAASRLGIELAETAAVAGLPPGVFNVLLGAGEQVGPPLIGADEVRAVSFTGSGRIGGVVATQAARRGIRFQTEMGGKNVVLVRRDADIPRAALLAAGGAMRFAGQKCTATSRAIVEHAVADQFLSALRSEVEALSLRPPTDASSAVGPVISEASRDAIRTALDGLDVHCIHRGVIPDSDAYHRGFWVPPTVLHELPGDSDVAQRELFGPVLATFVADDLDHMIALANATPFGLSASLFTRDLPSALHYVQRIQAGLVRINGDTTGVDPHAPFGGMKASSSGSREQGPAAREFYTDIKTVQVSG